MESLNQTPGFCYHSSDSEGEIEFSGILEIFAHHARNIHNICIYDNQDVYAKFSLTYSPDEMVSTRVIVAGGKNPEFNEKLALKVTQNDAVLKCEIWMLSRVKAMLEDQLLGFTLVPISYIISQGGKINCQDFSLSSTDLFHSPAGTVQLSLSFSSNSSSVSFPSLSAKNLSISSEVVLLDTNDYLRVEFPDINAASEDQMMIVQYFNSNRSLGSFLQLGSAVTTEFDHEMVGNSLEGNVSSPGDQNMSLSNDRNEANSSSIEKRSQYSADDQLRTLKAETREKQSIADDHPRVGDKREDMNETEGGKQKQTDYGNAGWVGNMDLEIEETAMQQQIVDMYMKSMHQFTESLAKMKLPMDLKPKADEGRDDRDMILVMEKGSKLEVENKKKDGSRVFYGSRAFF